MVVVELACWPRSFLCLSPAAMLILLLLLWGGNAWRNKTWKVMKLCEAGPPLLLWQCFAWRENALGSRSSEGEKEAEEETVASCSSTRFSATKMRPSSRLPSGERERERVLSFNLLLPHNNIEKLFILWTMWIENRNAWSVYFLKNNVGKASYKITM